MYTLPMRRMIHRIMNIGCIWKRSNLTTTLNAIIIVIILCFTIYHKQYKNAGRSSNHKNRTPAETYSEVSSYRYQRRLPAQHYPLLRKRVACTPLMQKLAQSTNNTNTTPPKAPPSDLKAAFDMNGRCPITQQWYFNHANNHKLGKTTYTNGSSLRQFLHKHQELIAMSQIMVVGSEVPWVEAMLLNLNASHVTTLEYADKEFQHPRLKVQKPNQFATSRVQFDVAVSYSSIEHSGLGRYGDALNPYGDLEAVAQVWCRLKEHGHFLLGVQVHPAIRKSLKPCYIKWNAGRYYGAARLQHLTANYRVLDLAYDDAAHVLLLLQKVGQAEYT